MYCTLELSGFLIRPATEFIFHPSSKKHAKTLQLKIMLQKDYDRREVIWNLMHSRAIHFQVLPLAI
ncbi:ATP-dependent protease peptidase subunit [Gimesia maris DSM 8797]|nr:ATP-dependent protease peptidase subunit [Gimesia maris DSM 8797]